MPDTCGTRYTCYYEEPLLLLKVFWTIMHVNGGLLESQLKGRKVDLCEFPVGAACW